MSRAAAATSQKGAQKAALKDKAAEHAADLAMGLTSTMKKLMAADSLICMACKATTLGYGSGPGKCECPGGKTKPPSDYDPKIELLAAATGREKTRKDAVKGASAANQSSVQALKAKTKAGKDLDDLSNLDLSAIDQVDVTFEAGSKLGMGIERNVVSTVAADGAAESLKVKVGWVVRKVGADDAPSNKAALMKACAAAMKAGPLSLTFLTPLEDGQYYCNSCDKFIDGEQFDGATNGVDAGPGKRVCCSCEEYGDMFG